MTEVSAARIRGTHHYSFRCGEWAEIIGVKMYSCEAMSERPTFECKYDDGTIDYIAISDAPNYEIGRGITPQALEDG